MTFEGWNWDIFSGISASILLILQLRGKLSAQLLQIWNYAGLILLAIIVFTAILSSPLPFQLMAFDQPNIAVLNFPFIFLPGIIVPIVILSHALLLKTTKL